MYDYYDFAYYDLYKNHNIITHVFFDKNLSNEILDSNKEEYKFFYYESKEDLINQIKKISINDIYYINTFDELLVLLLNEIKKEI